MNTLKIERRKLDELKPASWNPRRISDRALAGLRASIERFGIVEPIIVNIHDGKNSIIGGHQRYRVLVESGETETDVVIVDINPAEEKALNVALNNPHIAGDFTAELAALLDEIQVDMPTVYEDLLLDDLRIEDFAPESLPPKSKLSDRFMIPPFSVLNAREGWWQDRKRAWIAIGIKSELGRGGNALDMSAASVGITDERERERWNAARRSSHKAASRRTDRQTDRNNNRGDSSESKSNHGSDGQICGKKDIKMAMHNDPMQRKNKYDER